jgi:glycosyltransferase involved in cell wall biosynthesis
MNLNKKSILFIAQYCDAGEESGNNRFDELARKYSALGKVSTVEIITSRFDHAKKKNRRFSKAYSSMGVDYKLINTIRYSKNISILRVASNLVFAIKLWFLLSQRKYKKMSLYYIAFPTPEAAAVAIWWASKRSIKTVLDVQDTWPEVFNLVKEKKGLYKVFYSFYKNISSYCYRNSNSIVAVSETYLNVSKSYGALSPMHSCFLGSSKSKLLSAHADRKTNIKLSKKKTDIVLVYLGTVGASYDLFTVIDAIRIADLSGPRLSLTIIGDGPSVQKVLDYADRLCVKVNFLGRIPYIDAFFQLEKCDIAVNSFYPKATQSIINKHGDYALARLPVVSNQNCDEYSSLLLEYDAGLVVPCNDPDSFAEAILLLARDSELRKRLSNGSYKMGLSKFDRDKTYPELIEWIENDIA